MCLVRQMAEQCKVSVHASLFFILLCGEPWTLSTTDLRLNLFSTCALCALCPQTSTFPPGLRVTGLSGQADASLSVQSEAGPDPRPAVPKSYLSVCLSSPAVVPASHLSIKWPSVMEHFDAMGIYKITQKHKVPKEVLRLAGRKKYD